MEHPDHARVSAMVIVEGYLCEQVLSVEPRLDRAKLHKEVDEKANHERLDGVLTKMLAA